MGQHAADWLEGKSIPQAMDILPSALNLQNIARYEADIADPGAVWRDPVRRAAYLKMYGNICYDTPRPVSEFSLVVGAEVAACSQRQTRGGMFRAASTIARPMRRLPGTTRKNLDIPE